MSKVKNKGELREPKGNPKEKTGYPKKGYDRDKKEKKSEKVAATGGSYGRGKGYSVK